MRYKLAVLGGTGDEGYGLALRWASAGHDVSIGSRSAERAQGAAQSILKIVKSGSTVRGFVNAEAVAKGDIVIVAVPFSALGETLKTVRPSFRPGHILVNVTVPLESAVGGRPTRTLGLWVGSAGELVASMVPKGVRVVSAFNNVSADLLGDLSRPVDCDILVCGDEEEAKKTVMDLASAIQGSRAVDAGSLENSRTIEQLTALLVSLNIRYGIKNAGVRVTGIDTDR